MCESVAIPYECGVRISFTSARVVITHDLVENAFARAPDSVRDRLVRAMAIIIIGVLFAFGVDLPSTPTQPWLNVFSCFSTWSIIIFNHCTVSAYCALHNGGQQYNKMDYTRSTPRYFCDCNYFVSVCVSVTFSADFSLALVRSHSIFGALVNIRT